MKWETKSITTLKVINLKINQLGTLSFDPHCKNCSKEFGYPLSKIFDPIEYKTIARLTCCQCKKFRPIYGKTNCENHYICKMCCNFILDAKPNCVFCNKKTKISIDQYAVLNDFFRESLAILL